MYFKKLAVLRFAISVTLIISVMDLGHLILSVELHLDLSNGMEQEMTKMKREKNSNGVGASKTGFLQYLGAESYAGEIVIYCISYRS